jgi:hypothetical protein
VGKEGNRKEDESELIGDVDSRGKEKDLCWQKRKEKGRVLAGCRGRSTSCSEMRKAWADARGK